jgi:hypothetical protein
MNVGIDDARHDGPTPGIDQLDAPRYHEIPRASHGVYAVAGSLSVPTVSVVVDTGHTARPATTKRVPPVRRTMAFGFMMAHLIQ